MSAFSFRMMSLLGMSFVLLAFSDGEEDVLSQPEQPDLRTQISEERHRILDYIRSELEPSLIDRDAQRLRRNVMRLGSFRKRWSQEAEDFLLANPALAEWFLYDYARVEHPHLTQRILEVLLKFESYQEPLAPLVFAAELSQATGGKAKVLQLFERVATKNPEPELLSLYQSFVQQEWRSELSPEDWLYFQLRLCPHGALPVIDAQAGSGLSDLWIRVLKSGLENCQRFL